ncbi:hypothetical protein ACIGXM_14050 [Kitasatospora sp. NPDC052896]|uniref:hypothetical protein n=1 Tax=Kitasatospora sp. NPDC052896 TaxID=3364061 RepID=UPI0037C5A8E5
MLTVVMVLEGVLRMGGSDAQIETGWALYQALARNSRLYVLSHEWPEDEMSTWMRQRNLTGHLAYLHSPDPGPQGRLDTLRRIRSWRVSLVIEPDPSCAAAEIADGWNTLLHTHALYTRPEWRPDHTGSPRPWDALTEEIERQQTMRLSDHRLHDE